MLLSNNVVFKCIRILALLQWGYVELLCPLSAENMPEAHIVATLLKGICFQDKFFVAVACGVTAYILSLAARSWLDCVLNN